MPKISVGPELVKARIAVSLIFLANGIGFSNLVPRYPEVVDALHLSKAAFGSAVAAEGVGALIAGLTASWLITRFTSARVATIGMLIIGTALIGAGLAHSWLAFAISLMVIGGMDAVVDVAQNAHGLRVQRHWGRSIVTSYHAAWSLGAVFGASMGSLFAGAGISLPIHMVVVFVLIAMLSLGPRVWLLPGDDEADRPEKSTHVDLPDGELSHSASDLVERGERQPQQHTPVSGSSRLSTAERQAPCTCYEGPACSLTTTKFGQGKGLTLTTLGLLGIIGLLGGAGIFPEDVGFNWSSLILADYGAPASRVGLGVVTLQSTMIIGRLVGDRVIDALGERAVVGSGGVLVMIGMGLGLLFPTVGPFLIGMAVAGVGCSVVVPIIYHAADDVPGLKPGLGLTIASWLARVILLIAPPLVGIAADVHGLWVALVYGVLGGLILALGWPVLRGKSPQLASAH
ncbi:MFS transporter [Actinomyces vulturis]|uniref:MFS transporter n=1 Tax=Actinomyces vulturis TaxID=1857645 RepID=UPI00082BC943|nr:MFS transporter [Actinomyces vulturis]